MTYEQIEKSFFEHFARYGVSIDEDEDMFKFESPEPSVILSFLKQSFIKYLSGEVEACNQYKTFYNPVGDEFNKGKHKAMDDIVERLQAQIKELEAWPLVHTVSSM